MIRSLSKLSQMRGGTPANGGGNGGGTTISRRASKESATSVEAWPSSGVRLGRATKEGKYHRNEDRALVADGLVDLLDEQAISVSEALDLFSQDGKLKFQADFLDSVALCAVYDGHGGPGCAEFLFNNLPTTLAKLADASKMTSMELAEKLFVKAFEETEAAFRVEALAKEDSSGACAVVAMIHGSDLVVAHCGDCRAVLRTAEGEVVHLTSDHRATVAEEMNRVIAAGGTIKQSRVYGILSPSRGFGDWDLKTKNPGVLISEPSLVRRKVKMYPSSSKKFAFMILASDGVWDVMTSQSACDFVHRTLQRNGGNAEAAALALVTAASKSTHDDVSATVVVWSYSNFYHPGSPRDSTAFDSPVTSPVVPHKVERGGAISPMLDVGSLPSFVGGESSAQARKAASSTGDVYGTTTTVPLRGASNGASLPALEEEAIDPVFSRKSFSQSHAKLPTELVGKVLPPSTASGVIAEE